MVVWAKERMGGGVVWVLLGSSIEPFTGVPLSPLEREHVRIEQHPDLCHLARRWVVHISVMSTF